MRLLRSLGSNGRGRGANWALAHCRRTIRGFDCMTLGGCRSWGYSDSRSLDDNKVSF
jgi:hypothetical protein